MSFWMFASVVWVVLLPTLMPYLPEIAVIRSRQHPPIHEASSPKSTTRRGESS